MPSKGKGASSKKSGAKSRRKTKPVKSPAETKSQTRAKAAEHGAAESNLAAQTFTRGVIIRGEAARPDASGSLPPGATHEIVGEDEQGLPLIERRRFSAF